MSGLKYMSSFGTTPLDNLLNNSVTMITERSRTQQENMLQHAAQFCAGEYVEVTCGSGQTLNIHSAMYGRMSVGRYEHSDCI